ncbi:hypothetical protein HS1_001580 [Candidatus Desulfofervidus auxilii]|uniref:Uncharacterized protein n=1 Tax=Desulfofervidus auxilii TaxID=1621989 RepID=A0A7U4QL88_DESA2|nr:hypothetical protein HS1_001580 [Candidatus Desulfofervidus auxilii]CAD7774143.1 MAG: hypothetical protein KCCBMMGE_00290 [Candidatus Methanoperedenaceae archaeon GB37]CAD7777971.1 hypothetical protein BLFGPEAP_01831 [Candidatus Methanoperedenaceae archaeon GB50]CAD7779038.1 hypothetical protein DMNBHIDG_01940 [Candidatus Methanoperedenaceae archaeon GB37]
MKNSGKTFDIIYAKGVKKDLKNISKSDLQRIKKAIEKLRNFPDIKCSTSNCPSFSRFQVKSGRIPRSIRR